MPGPANDREVYEFGHFRVDVTERILSKGHQVIPFTPKAFDTLVVLVRNSGHVVEKDALLKQVWPDTFVEEGVLAVNVAAIRKALSDGDEGRSYVETVPRRGYRFIGEVRALEKSSESGTAPGQSRQLRRSRLKLWGLVAGSLALMLGALGWFRLSSRSTPPPPTSSPIPLTSYPGIELSPSFSPDGSQVAFSWNGKDQNNFDIYVKLIDQVEAHRLTSDPARDMSPAWAPDGRTIAFAREGAVYLIAPTGDGERRLADVRAADIEWTADSRSLIVSARTPAESNRLLRISVDSGKTTELTSPPEQSLCSGDFNPAVSPDGGRIAFVRFLAAGSADVYQMSVTGGHLQRLTQNEGWIFGLTWTPDGREVVYSALASLRRKSVDLRFDLPSKRVDGVDPAGVTAPAISRPTSVSPVRLAYERLILESNIWG